MTVRTMVSPTKRPLSTEYLLTGNFVSLGAISLTIVVAILIVGAVAGEVAAAERPNILLIVSDDQGWPDLGCKRYSLLHILPGVRFVIRAHAPSSLDWPPIPFSNWMTR